MHIAKLTINTVHAYGCTKYLL